MSFLDDAISTLGRGLAQTAVGALSDASGFDVGNTLNVLFGNGQATAGQNLVKSQDDINSSNLPQADIQQLTSDINQQIVLITDLGNQLSSLANQVSALVADFGYLKDLLQKIQQEQLYITWADTHNSIIQASTVITTSYELYAGFLVEGVDPSNKSGPVLSLAGDITSPNGGAAERSKEISGYLVDDNQYKGALQLWSNMVTPLIADGILDYRRAVNEYIAYYQHLAYIQLQAANLAMEGWNLLGESSQADAAWTQYRTQLANQEISFLNWLIAIVTTGTAFNLAGAYPINAALAAVEINPMALIGGQSARSNPVPYYVPSLNFQRAEQVLAGLAVTQPSDRRLVIYMAYDGSPSIRNVVENAEVTITAQANGHRRSTHHSHHPHQSFSGTPIPPSSVQALGPFTTANGTDPLDDNMKSQSVWINRFVFETIELPNGSAAPIPDAAYSLTDINGSAGLTPIETYACYNDGGGSGPSAKFLHDAMLSYTMHISGTGPFNFANFLAYVFPASFRGLL